MGKQHDAQDAATAVRYVTKYIVKYPKAGFPKWVMQKTRIRFVMASKAVGALVTQGERSPRVESADLLHAEDVEKDDVVKERTRHSLEQRGMRCGLFSNVVVRSAGVTSWGGEVPFLPGSLAYASKLGLITRPIRTVTVEDRYGGSRLEVSIPLDCWENIEDVLSGVMREMEEARAWNDLAPSMPGFHDRQISNLSGSDKYSGYQGPRRADLK